MSHLNILLVDDNPQFLKVARQLIAALPGVDRIDCANSGGDALARAAKSPPDLVLTDIQMPSMNGFEVIRTLRAWDAPPRVVAMTVHDSPQYRAAALRMGAEECIAKHDLAMLLPEMIASLAGSAAESELRT
jgi:CheY-like chemotaxis protein